MQLDGFLSRFALRELLELSVASLVNGALEVHAPNGTHRLFFVEGRCVHAASPSATGFDALWPLFELIDAPFRFVAGLSTSERTLHEPTAQLIDQAEGLAMQWASIRPAIPHLEIVPQLTMPANGEQVRIYEEDWPVLSWVDGARTIAEIAGAAILDPIEVCSGLLRLKDRGLVSLSQRQPPVALAANAPAAPAAPRHAALSGPAAKPKSFFARLLTDAPVDVLNSMPLPAEPSSAPAEQEQPVASEVAGPTEYDDILRLLRT